MDSKLVETLEKIAADGREVVTLNQLISEGLPENYVEHVKELQLTFSNATVVLHRNPRTSKKFGYTIAL